MSKATMRETTDVRVKPLEWSQSAPPAHDHEPFVYWAAGVGGHYRAEPDGLLWMAHDAFIWEQHTNQKAAKAAAQTDYERRILAALEPAPKPAGGERCSLGVGCDECGVCYADAHGQPDQCGRSTSPSADSAQDVGVLVEAMRKLEGAFCQFLNEAGDPFEPVDQWRESVAKAFCDLSRAWNDAYAKGLSSETLAAYKRSATDGKS